MGKMKMSNKMRLVYLLAMTCVITACQKTEKHTEQTEDAQKTTATVSTKQNAEQQLTAKCQSLNLKIKALTNKFAPKKLNELNQSLKTCIPHVALEKRYQWIQDSEQIYANLLAKSSTEVYQYMTDTIGDREEMTTASKKALYAQLKPEEQYLVDHAKALYLEKYYVGEGEYTFVQHPQYYIDLFVPDLEKADQIYFKQLRKEYTGSNYILDAGLAISFDEVAQRLMFWENYLQHYPKAHYSPQVKALISSYRDDLFHGHENTRTLWFDQDKIADHDALKAIEKLAASHSSSNQTAQKFLKLIQASEAQWQQLPKPSQPNDDYDTPEQQQIRAQRAQLQEKIQNAVDQLLKTKA